MKSKVPAAFQCPLSFLFAEGKKKKDKCCKKFKDGDRCKKCPGRK
ncbi:MAG: hypothetical protein Q8M29_19615 [Bacteroidota bacterium]|nr:hypothetical protein [Bacteroidota bacterium]